MAHGDSRAGSGAGLDGPPPALDLEGRQPDGVETAGPVGRLDDGPGPEPQHAAEMVGLVGIEPDAVRVDGLRTDEDPGHSRSPGVDEVRHAPSSPSAQEERGPAVVLDELDEPAALRREHARHRRHLVSQEPTRDQAAARARPAPEAPARAWHARPRGDSRGRAAPAGRPSRRHPPPTGRTRSPTALRRALSSVAATASGSRSIASTRGTPRAAAAIARMPDPQPTSRAWATASASQRPLEELEAAPGRPMAAGAEGAPRLDQHDEPALRERRRRRLPRRAHEQPPPHRDRPEVGAPGIGPRLVGEGRDPHARHRTRQRQRHQIGEVAADVRRERLRVGARREEGAKRGPGRGDLLDDADRTQLPQMVRDGLGRLGGVGPESRRSGPSRRPPGPRASAARP